MAYRIEFTPLARRQLDKLERSQQVRIAAAVDSLAENPRRHGVEKMQGPDDFYRLRVGEWRIIFQIHDRVLLVVVVRIGNRKDVYR